MAKIESTHDAKNERLLAEQSVLPIRKELISQLSDVHRHLLITVTTPGSMGTVANWQQHVMPLLLEPSEQYLTRILDGPLPADAMPPKQYLGKPRLFVPAVRTVLVAGERLKLKIVVLGGRPREAALSWRALGTAEFTKVPLQHVARGVHTVELPTEKVKEDFEYYVQATAADGTPLKFPPTAPALNQTVVVVN